MDFWNNTLTEKSWNILKELNKRKFNFIVIGGWACYLWTNLHKSKDVDIAIENFDDLAYLKKNYDLRKNDNLKRYEIKIEEIDIDIYVPFFSKLSIPIEDLAKHVSYIQDFKVAKPEILLILKQGAEIDRQFSVKGEKDGIDVISLLFYADINFDEYFRLIKKYRLEYFYERLKKIVNGFKDIEYLGLNPREFKLRKQRVLNDFIFSI